MTQHPGPLGRRAVLVTRPPSRAAGLIRRLVALGARVEARPTFALEPPRDPGPARRAVSGLERYDWIVFTSANGVRFFRRTLEEVRGGQARLACSVAAIGPATAAELGRLGHSPDVVASDSRSEGLARSLAGRIVAADRVLVVRPETARPLLPRAIAALGARVDAVAFYRNVADPGVDGVVEDLCSDHFDVVIWSSPSSLERVLECRARPRDEIVRALERTRLVAIGPVTARAVERAGLRPAAVATEPTDDALVDAVRKLFL